MNVLLIDDQPLELKMLTREFGGEVMIHWAPTIGVGKDILDSQPKGYFAAVFVDVMGTSLRWEEEIKTLNHPNVIMISCVSMPMATNFKFLSKDQLVDFVRMNILDPKL